MGNDFRCRYATQERIYRLFRALKRPATVIRSLRDQETYTCKGRGVGAKVARRPAPHVNAGQSGTTPGHLAQPRTE